MIRVLLTLIIILLPICAHSSEDMQRNHERYAGTYSYGLKPKSKDGHFGLIYIYPTKKDSILFYIEISRGTPSYNSGALEGEIKIHNKSAIYFKKSEYSEKNCKWNITFSDKDIVIKTIDFNNECGFGHNVYADGVYKKTSNKVPVSYITRTEEKVFFKNLEKK